MGKWIDIVKEWNKRRKKGLKNPTVLWSTGFILTFALTILPSVLVTALGAKNSALLLNQETWITAIINNLYPMIITQSVVTMLQNFSIATPSRKEKKSRQFVLCISLTHLLVVFLIFYIIFYPALVYANPSWRNLALYIISGILAAVGLGSVLQLNREQERVQKAIEEEKYAEDQAKRALAWNSPPVDLTNIDSSFDKAEEELVGETTR